MKRLLLGIIAAFAFGGQSQGADEVSDLASVIDRHIATRWSDENAVPAPAADDAEFLRRVSLHLTGKIPRVSEVREFLEDSSPDKRRQLVDRLLESPAYIVNFTNVWRTLLIPEANNEAQFQIDVAGFEAWLRQQFTDNTPYDVMVRELLNAKIDNQQGRTNTVAQGRVKPNPGVFFLAKQDKLEIIAAGVSRQFMGVRLECAQCHDHPFAKWQRNDFWQFAAFFNNAGGVIKIPETEQFVQASFLSGEKAVPKAGTSYRGELADWLTSEENPYFARAAVNRLWFHFFGTGLVEPVDDFDADNPASHPELLDELAAQFAAHDFDLKYLMRGILASRAYQLTSRQTDDSQSDPRLFAKMAIQGLTTGQLFDSLAEATGFFESNADRNPLNVNDNSERAKFRQLFANEAGESNDAETTILQALTLMNGEFVENATDIKQSTTLAAVVESPFLDTAERVRTLYLAALSRYPNDEELTTMVQYVDSGGANNDSQSALADLFWVLLNSSEFILNH